MLKNNTFPKTWKKARVIPLFKKGDEKEMSNYRPISLLPALSKVAEKVMTTQIYKYCELFNLFPKRQYGFRKAKSTNQAVNDLVYEIEKLKQKNATYALVTVDFSKAFDLIDHEILYQKLQKLGFQKDSIALIKSYLSDREQYTEVNGKKSSTITLGKKGSPQGSCISPLLYLIYTIDLKYLLDAHFHIMFADDTAVLIQIDKRKETTEKITLAMEKMYNHFTLNKLKMNLGKTNVQGKNISGSINLKGTNIPILDKDSPQKYLGVWISANLNWTEHCCQLKKKLRTGLLALSKLKKLKNKKIKILIYNALIKSHLMYGITAWYPTLTKKQRNGLQTLQKVAIRLIMGTNKKSHTGKFFKELKILKLHDLYICSVIAQFRTLKSSENRNNPLIERAVYISRNTRSQGKLKSKTNAPTIMQHVKIINDYQDTVNSPLTTKTVMKNLIKILIGKYDDSCDRPSCYLCSN